MTKKRKGRPSKVKAKPLGDDELPPIPELKRPRIEYVKEYPVSRSTPGRLADRINDELGDRSKGNPEIKAVHQLEASNGLVQGEHRALVVFKRDERRLSPSRRTDLARRSSDKESDG